MKMRLIFFTILIGIILFFFYTPWLISFFPRGAETEKTVERLYGPTRYNTAVAISKKGWTTCDNIVLARGDLFPDALAGAPLAAKLNSPILLTDPLKLTPATRDEIKRLKAKQVYILGSEDAVSEEVAVALTSECGISQDKISRYSGLTRYETASQIANSLNPPTNKTAIITYGENYPDALSAASMAAYNGMPILLVRGTDVGTDNKSILQKFSINKTLLLGETDVVSWEIADWLSKNNYNPSRLGGLTRYETCYEISSYGIEKMGLSQRVVAVATGENFPDALALGPLAGRNKAPVLLVMTNVIPDKITEFFTDLGPTIYTAYVAGGPDVVTDDVEVQIVSYIGM